MKTRTRKDIDLITRCLADITLLLARQQKHIDYLDNCIEDLYSGSVDVFLDIEKLKKKSK